MSKSLIFIGSATGVAPGTGMETNPAALAWSAGDRFFRLLDSGTFSLLGVNINDVGSSQTYRVNDNGGNDTPGCIVTPTDTTAGWFEDLTGTEHVSSGAQVDVGLVESGTNPTTYGIRTVYESDSGHVTLLGIETISNNASSDSIYGAKSGGSLTLEAMQIKMPAAGTIDGLFFKINSNTRTGTDIVGININGTMGNTKVSVPHTTGTFATTTESDSISANDLITFELANDAGTGSFTILQGGCLFKPTSGTKSPIVVSRGTDTTRNVNHSTMHFIQPGGSLGSLAQTTESLTSVQPRYAMTISNLRVYVSTNSYTTDATIYLRKNSGAGNQTITITGGPDNQWFEGSGSPDDIAATDFFNFAIQGGTSGSLVIKTITATIEETAVGGVTGHQKDLPMLGVG